MNEQSTLFPIPENIVSDKCNQEYKGKPRILFPIRNQSEMKVFCIDTLIPHDHKARMVWSYIQKLDLSPFTNKIDSTAGKAGRSAIDPGILLALWLYATIEGIGSGRVIEKYCKEHNAFQWICGGITVTYHTINDFRINHKDELNKILTQSIAIFLDSKVIDLDSISQDGIRVRAHAGGSSFRRTETLQDHLILAENYVKDLQDEIEENTNAFMKRKKNAELAKAIEKEQKISKAIEELKKIEASKEEQLKSQRKNLTEEDKKKIRASTTDPEARKMKMANGGFNPAYNVQLATDTKSKVIVGLEVVQAGADAGLMSQMHQQVVERSHVNPSKWMSDGGYTDAEDIENLKKANPKCEVLVPVKNSHDPENFKPKKDDSEVIKEWRINMGTIEAKESYKNRASSSEFVNAQARNRGLQQFVVRGLSNVTSSMLIFVITHNMVRAWSLMS